jgi:hypothetical protein
MITTDLAADIKNGVAQYRTFVCGIGQSNRLPVPKNSYIIICDLLIMPFIDENIGSGEAAFDLRRILMYEFTSDKSSNHFVIRHQFTNVVAEAGVAAICMEPPVKVDTYLVHTSEVRISIYHMTPLGAGAVITMAALDDVSQEPDPPVGSGTKTSTVNFAVVTNVQLALGDNQIIPVGAQNNDPVATPITTSYVDQVKSANIANNSLNDPSTLDHENSYPIVNIGYVLYQNSAPPKVKSS